MSSWDYFHTTQRNTQWGKPSVSLSTFPSWHSLTEGPKPLWEVPLHSTAMTTDGGVFWKLPLTSYWLLNRPRMTLCTFTLLFFWSSGKKGWLHSTTLFLSINFMKLLLSQCLSTTIHTTCIRGMKVLPHKCNIYLCLTSVCSGLCMKTQQQTYGMCFLQVQVFIIGIQRFNAECQRPQLLHPKKTKLKTTGGGKTLNWNW